MRAFPISIFIFFFILIELKAERSGYGYSGHLYEGRSSSSYRSYGYSGSYGSYPDWYARPVTPSPKSDWYARPVTPSTPSYYSTPSSSYPTTQNFSDWQDVVQGTTRVSSVNGVEIKPWVRRYRFLPDGKLEFDPRYPEELLKQQDDNYASYLSKLSNWREQYVITWSKTQFTNNFKMLEERVKELEQKKNPWVVRQLNSMVHDEKTRNDQAVIEIQKLIGAEFDKKSQLLKGYYTQAKSSVEQSGDISLVKISLDEIMNFSGVEKAIKEVWSKERQHIEQFPSIETMYESEDALYPKVIKKPQGNISVQLQRNGEAVFSTLNDTTPFLKLQGIESLECHKSIMVLVTSKNVYVVEEGKVISKITSEQNLVKVTKDKEGRFIIWSYSYDLTQKKVYYPNMLSEDLKSLLQQPPASLPQTKEFFE